MRGLPWLGFKFFFWLGLISCSLSCNRSSTLPNERLLTQVLVVGAGTSGVAAALQAARTGAQVIVVEETPWVGGMLTAAGVSATDGNHHLPSGIWGEFRAELYKHYGGPDSVATGWVSNTLFEPHVGNRIWNRLLEAEPNIRIYHGYRPIRSIQQANKVEEIWFVNSQGDSLKVKAAVTVDATELGDLLPLAQVAYLSGQDARAETLETFAPDTANDHIQDLTYSLILREYESDQTIDAPPGYDPEAFNCACRELCDNPEFEVVSCAQMMLYGKLPGNKYMINWPINGNDHYVNSLEMTHQQRNEAYEQAKLQSLRFLYHLQTKGGFSNFGIAHGEFPTEDGHPFMPYHRESRRVQGVNFLTVNHLQNPYNYDLYRDAIAVGDYPLDHHHDKNKAVSKEDFPSIPSFSIPYGCIIPQSIDGLIVAEKSISVSHIANGATRLQPCVVLIGQAAGAAAALSALEQMQPRELPLRILQQHLLDQGCWLLPFMDTNPADSVYFQSIQRVGLSGLMQGTGVPYKWANQTWFYPDSAYYFSNLINALEKLNFENLPEFEVDYVLQREAMIGILWEALNAPNPDKAAPYSDINAQSNAINYCFQQGWLEPWTGTELLKPQQQITRKEAAFLLDRVFEPFNKH